MKAKEVREKYLKFFEKQGHKRIDPAPLVLENDPTTLFTSSGMQPLVPYLMGDKHPLGKRLVDSQPSIRTVDIDEVGDNRHLTFFEMLGNWSLGDYFKEEQLPWIFEFFTKELELSKDNIWVSVFEGNEQVSRDDTSIGIWKKLGIPEKKIRQYGVKKNWWSRSGTPEEMPVGEIGGPDSEIFYEFTGIKHNPVFGTNCHPNCDCGRFVEIGNSVFMQYKKVGDGKLEELPQKNVDFGGGFERIAAVVNGDPDSYKSDLFYPCIEVIQEFTGVKYGLSQKTDRSFRIIADHLRASAQILARGVVPSNKLQGYVLRRLIRRSVFQLRQLGFDLGEGAVSTFAKSYAEDFEIIGKNWAKVKDELNIEAVKFNSALKRGTNKLIKIVKNEKVTGKVAFDLYQTEGFPLELTLEILESEGKKFNKNDRVEFEKEFESHKNLSRTTSAGVFKGGLADHSPEVVKLHTATHLLLASLRKVLGEHVVQKGQNITPDRSRFDFPNGEKLTEDQLKKVEDMLNDIIQKDLPVQFEVMPKEAALKTGAIHAFNEKYSDTVKVYFVGKDIKSAFSKEFCGGPHVERTGMIGRVRIKKQEKIGSGLIRIYLVLE
jgi:alanyl-tRNA synthetase